jgi:hypothetical protein
MTHLVGVRLLGRQHVAEHIPPGLACPHIHRTAVSFCVRLVSESAFHPHTVLFSHECIRQWVKETDAPAQ